MARQVIDALGYAVTIVFLAVGLGTVVMLATGTGWFVTEFVMFLIGWLLIAYGTLLLNPDPPWTTRRTETGALRVVRTETDQPSDRSETAFQRLVQWLPPMRWYPLAPRDRLSTGLRVFLSGVFVLLASFALERLVIV